MTKKTKCYLENTSRGLKVITTEVRRPGSWVKYETIIYNCREVVSDAGYSNVEEAALGHVRTIRQIRKKTLLKHLTDDS